MHIYIEKRSHSSNTYKIEQEKITKYDSLKLKWYYSSVYTHLFIDTVSNMLMGH